LNCSALKIDSSLVSQLWRKQITFPFSVKGIPIVTVGQAFLPMPKPGVQQAGKPAPQDGKNKQSEKFCLIPAAT
jgi:hypothetical protein